MQDTLSKPPNRHYFASSGFKAAIAVTCITGMAIFVMFWGVETYRQSTFSQFIGDTIDAQIETMTAHHRSGGLLQLQNEIRDLAVRDSHLYYMLIDDEGGLVAGNFRGLPSAPTTFSEGLIGFDIAPDDRLQIRMGKSGKPEAVIPRNESVSVAGKIVMFPEGYRMVVARNMEMVYGLQRQVGLISLVVSLFMGAIILIAFFFSFYAVKRINRIAETARRIMDTGDLSQRIDVVSRWDDLDDLSVILNQLLEQVEAAMQGVKQVSDSIAHDLRTPLSRLRNHLEILKNEEMAQCDGSRAKVDEIIAEADHLLSTFHAVLRISNIEQGRNHKQFEPVDMRALVADVCEMYEPLAEEKRQNFKVSLEEVSLAGDKDLLFQAVANLVDNAIKYTPDLGEVTVRLSENAQGRRLLEITDSGIGIPEAEREKVFRRFYRVDTARCSGAGNGLGLAMVAAIMKLHDIDVTLSDNKPGLRVQLALPTLS